MENTCNCGFYPTIVIPGIGDCKAYDEDEQGNRLRMAWPPDIDAAAMKKLKNSLIFPALRMLVLRHDLGFTKKAGEAISEALDTLASTPDGQYKHNVKVETYDASLAECSEAGRSFIYRMLPLKPLAEHIGEDHMFYFAFVPIGNTEDTVERLREFIQMVKQKTGHAKVNLASVSLGATITTAYLDAYAADGDINRVVGVVPAFDGSMNVSDIMKGNIAYDDYEVLFIELMGRKTAAKVIKVAKLLPKKVLRKFIEAVVGAVVDTVIVNASNMWGLVPAHEYEALSKKLISDPAHAKIKEQTDRWWKVRSDFPAMVAKARENGIDIFALCGYNVQLYKVVKSTKESSDMVVHSASESMGAKFAPLGETFGKDYKQQNLNCKNEGHNHINPQNDVDASCGAAPDTTWFWRNMEHEQAADNKPLLELMKLLLSSNDIKDVFQDPAYPQFNEFVKEEEK
jgi:pimeloyl-ACP methyl ester carboxylesterase